MADPKYIRELGDAATLLATHFGIVDQGGDGKRVLLSALKTFYVAGFTASNITDASANGRSLITAANYSAMRTLLGLVLGTDVEAHDPDLTTIAGLTPANDDVLQRKSGAWTNRTIAQLLSDLGIAANYQPLDSDLTSIAALSTTSYGRAFLALADAAATRSAIGLVLGTDIYSKAAVDSGFQPLDSDLTSVAALATATYGRSLLTLADAQALIASANTTRAYFHATKPSGQSGITDNTATKITFPTEVVDQGSFYDNATNYRWTPPAGPVTLFASALFTGTTAAGSFDFIAIYKNGSNFKRVYDLNPNASSISVHAFDVANGTDYYEVFGLIDTTGGTWGVSGGADYSYFFGYQI